MNNFDHYAHFIIGAKIAGAEIECYLHIVGDNNSCVKLLPNERRKHE